MFPRPSRICRLLILLSVIIFIAITMYMVSFDVLSTHYTVPFDSNIQMKAKGSNTSFFVVHSNQENKQDLPVMKKALYPTLRKSGFLFHEMVMGTSDKNISVSDNRHGVAMTDGAFRNSSHHFDYIHNPTNVCHGNITFLIYIHSAPDNLKKRQAVRNTWGHPKLLSLYNSALIFILGRALNPAAQSLIDMESVQFGDILQENFIDSYRNLTYKGLAGLKWAGTYCSKTSFLLKTDDDILVDIVSFMEHLYTRILPYRDSHMKLVLCNVWTKMKVIRDSKSKWFVSRHEFSEDYFPTYCSGSAFLLSGDLISSLYHTALQTPFFWIDDYYVTGMLVNKLKVQHTRLNPAYLLNYNLAEEKLQNGSRELMIFHVKKLSLFLKLWPVLLQRHNGIKNYLEPVTVYSRKKKERTLILNTVSSIKYTINQTGEHDIPPRFHENNGSRDN